MYLLGYDGSVEVPPTPADNMTFSSVVQCEAYKKRMGYSKVDPQSRIRFVCKQFSSFIINLLGNYYVYQYQC